MENDFEKSSVYREAYLANWDSLYIYAYNVLGNKKACEDIVQEIFLLLWKNRQKIDEIDNLPGYLFQALRFQIFRYFRDKKATLDIDRFNNMLLTNNTSDTLARRDRELEINGHMEKLPKRCKEIFYLSRIENMAHREIADELNISIQTVKNQISKALKFLRVNMEEATL